MILRAHAAAATVALLTVLSFMTGTLAAELWLGAADVALVKRYIVAGLFILVPALAITGATGFTLSRKAGSRFIDTKMRDTKMRRMKVIAFNGLVILVPSALYLCSKAQAGDFDAGFIAVQALELAAGAVNVMLMSLNMRDGLRLTRGRRASLAAS